MSLNLIFGEAKLSIGVITAACIHAVCVKLIKINCVLKTLQNGMETDKKTIVDMETCYNRKKKNVEMFIYSERQIKDD
jgi:hypothetical protein